MRGARWVRWTVTAAVVAAAFLATLNEAHDWDAFHHLALGRDLLRRGGFAPEDPFLFPLAGQPAAPPQSWLGSLAIYLSWRLAGDAGPLLLVALLSAGIFAVLVREALGEAGEDDRTPAGIAAALLPLGLALAVFRGRAVPRPELFADLLLVATVALLRARAGSSIRGDAAPPAPPPLRGGLLPPPLRCRARALAGALALPVLLAAWANVHQSVLAGVGLAGLSGAVGCALLLAPRAGARLGAVPARAAAYPLVGAAAGILLAGLATPAGFAPFREPARYVLGWALPAAAPAGAAPLEGGGLVASAITELQPLQLHALDPFGWLLALTAASFLAAALATRRVAVVELVACAAFAVLGLRVVRFGAMACLVLAPVAARNLRAALPLARGRAARALPWAAPLAAAALLAPPWASTLARSSLRFGLGQSRQLPARAAAYLRAAGPAGRLFDTFHFGGYLEWTLDRPVYQDGRGNVRPDEAQAALLGPASPEAFDALDARYRFDALVVEYPEFRPELVAALAARRPDDDWLADRRRFALVAFDDGGLLYLRRDGAYAALAARDEYRFARPAVPPGVGTRALAEARADLERSLREAPGCAICANALGWIDLGLGRPAEAEAAFAAARGGAPLVRAQALYGAAQAAGLRGDRDAAVARLREVIPALADPAGPRRQLAALLAAGGRAREALDEALKNLSGGPVQAADVELAAALARQAGDADLAGRLERQLRSLRP